MKVSTDSAIRLDLLHFKCMRDRVKAAEFMQCYLVEPAVSLPVGDEPMVLKVRYTGYRALTIKPGEVVRIGTGLLPQSRGVCYELRSAPYWGKRGLIASMEDPWWSAKGLPRELVVTLRNAPEQTIQLEVAAVIAQLHLFPIKA